MQALDSENIARLKLFIAIEPGSAGWTSELNRMGALQLIEAIENGYFDPQKVPVNRVASKLINIELEQVFNELEKANANFIFPGHKLWPAQVEDLKCAPIGLIIRGNTEVITELNCSISIVGTRNPTNYGNRTAYEFASALSASGWSVISGGAVGIDSVAHYGALDLGGKTISVLGGGVVNPYPIKNQRLFDEILETGLLVSEYMPFENPLPHRFLIRNRLIAALSKGTLVIEAAKRSGSIRTAREAAEIFRPVMAIPGPINVPTSEGCHKLISERCAELVSSVSDVMELVNPLA